MQDYHEIIMEKFGYTVLWLELQKAIKINLRDLINQVDSLEFAVYA